MIENSVIIVSALIFGVVGAADALGFSYIWVTHNTKWPPSPHRPIAPYSID